MLYSLCEDNVYIVCPMQEFIRALELALHETASPLSVAEECLTQRENRTGVDKVQDEVELALIKVTSSFFSLCISRDVETAGVEVLRKILRQLKPTIAFHRLATMYWSVVTIRGRIRVFH